MTSEITALDLCVLLVDIVLLFSLLFYFSYIFLLKYIRNCLKRMYIQCIVFTVHCSHDTKSDAYSMERTAVHLAFGGKLFRAILVPCALVGRVLQLAIEFTKFRELATID